MLRTSSPVAWMLFVLIGMTGFTGIAWQKNPTAPATRQQQDTIPAKEDNIIINGDLDRAIEQVNRAKENLERQLEKMDWQKMHRDMSESFEKMNTQKMQEKIARAMKQIDLKKIQMQTQQALKQVEWQKMQAEMEKVHEKIAAIDNIKMEKEMHHAMEKTREAMEHLKSIDSKQMHLQMEKAMEKIKQHEGMMKEGMEKARKHSMEHFGEDFERKMENAREKINRAGEALRNYKEMVAEMDKDGLLNIKESYTIEYKDEELIINGTKQPAAVTDKYKHYFKKGNVKIKKDKEDGNRTIYL